MSAKTARAKLARLTKDVLIEWGEAKSSWRDAKAREFEKDYLSDLPDAVNQALTLIEELDQALTRIRKDCE